MVPWSVTYGSPSAKPGSSSRTGVSQVTRPSETALAMTVPVSDLDTEAIWNTVSASTGSSFPATFVP